jgi:ABC-type dipeptide/oligopeptide/nickel transport system ATPase component
MRQRVMIAMSMLCEPDLLIADEPTTALDVTVQAQVLDIMDELKDETGAAIALITHDMGVVARMADRVQVMKHGEYVETGDVHAIFNTPPPTPIPRCCSTPCRASTSPTSWSWRGAAQGRGRRGQADADRR